MSNIYLGDVNISNYVSKSGGELYNGATLKFTQYGSRHITISGNNIIADMSNDIGTWAGSFLTLLDPVSATELIGWYGNTEGLIYMYMGGTYSNPYMYISKSGDIWFKNIPTVNGASLITTNDLDSAINNFKTKVKGSAESTYREGNVNITPANLGITVVNNTADSNKSVKYATSAGSATKATQDGSGNNIVNTYATKSQLSSYATTSQLSNYVSNSALSSTLASYCKMDILYCNTVTLTRDASHTCTLTRSYDFSSELLYVCINKLNSIGGIVDGGSGYGDTYYGSSFIISSPVTVGVLSSVANTGNATTLKVDGSNKVIITTPDSRNYTGETITLLILAIPKT